MNKFCFVFLVAASSAALSGCCLFTPCIKPPEPAITVAPPLAEALPSRVTLDVTADIASYLDAAKAEVPRSFDISENWRTKPGMAFHVNVEVPSVDLTLSQGKIAVSLGIHYKAKGCSLFKNPFNGNLVCGVPQGTCGYDSEWPRKMSAATRIDFGVGENWMLTTAAETVSVTTHNDCTFGALALFKDLTPTIKSKASGNAGKLLNKLTASLVGASQIKESLSKSWIALQEPLKLADDVWLELNPSALAIQKTDASNTLVSLNIELVSKPRITTSPGNIPPIDLPPNRPITRPTGFFIQADAKIGFQQASTEINERLRNRRFLVQGRELIVKRANVYGTGGMVMLHVEVDGDAKGDLYLQGKPAFNAATNRLTVEGLDFHVETKNLIVQVADWLLHEQWRGELASAAEWDLSEEITKYRTGANARLNGEVAPGIQAETALDQLQLTGVSHSEKDFLVRVTLSGYSRLKVVVPQS